VVTTGGLGPTADDITREGVAEAVGQELQFSPHLMAGIEAFFRARGFKLSPSNRRQAFIPRGAIPIENPVGTAPGFVVEVGERCLVTLPGVPREMEHLLIQRAIPYLKQRYGLHGMIRLRVLRICGLGESRVGELLADFMERGQNPTVGTLAHLGQVDVRIAAKGSDEAEAHALITPVEAEIRRRLGDLIFGVDHETLEGVVGAQLERVGGRVALVELGTAGVVAERLSAGAFKMFAGGMILGSLQEARWLGADLRGEGAPQDKARFLARAIRQWGGVEVGAATMFEEVRESQPPTVGVGLAVSLDGREEERAYTFGGDLPSIRIRTATLTLDLLRRTVPG
jgi:nicotinamide-nucleotide amidase